MKRHKTPFIKKKEFLKENLCIKNGPIQEKIMQKRFLNIVSRKLTHNRSGYFSQVIDQFCQIFTQKLCHCIQQFVLKYFSKIKWPYPGELTLLILDCYISHCLFFFVDCGNRRWSCYRYHTRIQNRVQVEFRKDKKCQKWRSCLHASASFCNLCH